MCIDKEDSTPEQFGVDPSILQSSWITSSAALEGCVIKPESFVANSLVLGGSSGNDAAAGKLTWRDGVLDFEGKVTESAKSFIEFLQRFTSVPTDAARNALLDIVIAHSRDTIKPQAYWIALDALGMPRHYENKPLRQELVAFLKDQLAQASYGTMSTLLGEERRKLYQWIEMLESPSGDATLIVSPPSNYKGD